MDYKALSVALLGASALASFFAASLAFWASATRIPDLEVGSGDAGGTTARLLQSLADSARRNRLAAFYAAVAGAAAFIGILLEVYR